MDILADYDLFQYKNKVKPDYNNTGWIERYEFDEYTGDYEWIGIDPEEELEELAYVQNSQGC